MSKKKVLCICNGGNVRSVALAEAFKGTYGCDAIAIGTYWAAHETMTMLCNWADLICPVDVQDAELPPTDLKIWRASCVWNQEFDHKRRVFYLGVDAWGNSKHPELLQLIHSKVKQEGYA